MEAPPASVAHGCDPSPDESLRCPEAKPLLLDAMTESLAWNVRDLRARWVNRAAVASVGQRAEDLVGCYCYEVWHSSLPVVHATLRAGDRRPKRIPHK